MIIYSDNHLGDLMCMERSIRHIKQVRPTERIEVFCKFPEVFKNNPDVDLADKVSKCGKYALTMKVRRDIHITEWLCSAAGIQAAFDDTAPKLWLDEADFEAIQCFNLPTDRPIMVFSYMTHATFKLWNSHNWSEIIAWAKEAGFYTVMLGTQQTGRGCDLDLTNKTTIRQAAAVLAKACLFVGIDAGLSHIAAAVGTKSVILYGPFDYRMIYHAGLIVPVYTDVCKDCRDKLSLCMCPRQRGNNRACMMSITLSQVKAAIEGAI